MFIFIVEDIKAVNTVWLVGDNFAAKTYRSSFDFKMSCNSRFNSAMKNMLIRLQNTVATAINNSKGMMLKFVIIILDDDLVSFLAFVGKGVGELIASWITWLTKQISELFNSRFSQLPVKAKHSFEPCIYWCSCPLHCNFSPQTNKIHRKINTCLDLICKDKPDMRVMKIKDKWSFDDKALVYKNKFTTSGLHAYWDAMDAAFKFNAQKREIFVAKQILALAAKKDNVNKEVRKEDGKKQKLGDIPQFFKRHQRDSFHWYHKDTREDFRQQTGNRFLLPKLKRR